MAKTLLSKFLPLFLLSAAACGPRRAPLEFEAPSPTFQTKAQARAGDIFRGNSEYLRNACFGQADEGGASASGSFPRITTAAFGKKIDSARFESVLAASPRATLTTIEREGARVYRVPLQAGTCALFAPVTEVPDDLWPIWSQANATVGGGMLALFLPSDRVRAQGHREPVIMIRADSDRYTLVHEYLHFLFDQSREGSESELLPLFEARAAKLRTLLPVRPGDLERRERALELTDAWAGTADVLIPLLDGFPLEEMAVESLLSTARREGRLQAVTDYSRRNGDRYIRSNWNRARPLLENLADDARMLTTALAKLGQATALARIEKIAAEVDKRKTEGQALADRAEAGTLRALLSSAIEGREFETAPADCGHAHGWPREIAAPTLK